MFGRGIRLPFKLLGIPVFLDWTFLLILPLLAFLIGMQVGVLAELFSRLFGIAVAPGLTETPMRYVLGFVAAIGLFIGVVLHELGHAVTARAYGVKIRSITLWFLGGVARFEEMPKYPGAEAVIAIVGPIVSVVLGVLCWIALGLTPDAAVAVQFVLAYLALMNVLLAVFNMIPALPLDGGRVLRSVLALFMPHLQATQIAGRISKGFAIVLALLAILQLNPFLLFIAIFIYLAVSAETTMTHLEDLLHGAPVRYMMNRDVKTVFTDTPLAEVTQRMLEDRHLGFPVLEHDGRVVGMVTLDEIRGQDPNLPVAQVMKKDIPTVKEDDEATAALRLMTQNNFGRLAVVADDGHLIGIVSKTDLLRVIQLRAISRDWTGNGQLPYHVATTSPREQVWEPAGRGR